MRRRRAVDRGAPADAARAAARALRRRGVRFVPRFVSDAELAAFFRRADVVVLPYARDRALRLQSGVLATALAFGKPTIVSDVGGFSEVAATGAARLVPPDDPEALAAPSSALLGDAGGRASGSRRRPGPRRPDRTRGPRRRAGRSRCTASS